VEERIVAQGWIHQFVDLVAFGRPYPTIHKEKDAAWKTLALNHRTRNHEWYGMHGQEWDFKDSCPQILKSFFKKMERKHGDKAEEFQIWVAHDTIEKVWDGLKLEETRTWALTFERIILDPLFLKESAGVDVLEGKIKRTLDDRYGFPEPIEYWENDPQVKTSYHRLRKYVESRSIDDLLYLRPRRSRQHRRTGFD
jgi:hypothetical protein